MLSPCSLKTYLIGLGSLLIVGGVFLTGCQSLGGDPIKSQDDAHQLSEEQTKAFQSFDAGQFNEAVKLFEHAITIERDVNLKAKLYNGLGASYDALEQQADAIMAYKESLKLNPENAQVWVNIGISQRLSGDFDEALRSYEAALLVDNTLATAHSSIGSLLILQGKPELAIPAFENALTLDDTLAVTYGNLALAYAMVQRFDQAELTLEQAIALGYENSALIQIKIDELKSSS